MGGRKETRISLKSFIIIAVILAVLVLIVIACIIFILKSKCIRIIENSNSGGEIATINYEGTFRVKGVVVGTENEKVYIMPIIANEEYSTEEKFYCEESKKKNLEQGQEVIVTYYYNNQNGGVTHEAVIQDVEVLKQKSDIEIPKDIFVKNYSTKDNVSIKIDDEKSSNSNLKFTIVDNNKFKYNYSTMEYYISKYNPVKPNNKIIYNKTGASISGYDPWPRLEKMNDLQTTSKYEINEVGQVMVDLDWLEVYGDLKEGEYLLTFSTVSNPKPSILNPNIIDYPYDGIIIDVNFKIDESGIIIYEDIDIR